MRKLGIWRVEGNEREREKERGGDMERKGKVKEKRGENGKYSTMV
jgi:hypothetical protein